MTAIQLMDSDVGYKQTALYDHYKSYNPKTLYDIYNNIWPPNEIAEKLKDYSFDCLFLPWIHHSPVTEYKDVAFIQRDKSFIKKQVKKIKKLINSINSNGYKPELFLDSKGGNITGYFLKSGNKKRFYVVSGNHRVAVLSALFPKKPIAVAFEEKSFMKPRDKFNRGQTCTEYDTKNINQWPSVKGEFISAEVAKNILATYMEN